MIQEIHRGRKIILFLSSIIFFLYAVSFFSPCQAEREELPAVTSSREAILKGLELHTDTIDISDWHMDAKELMHVFGELTETMPMLFFVFPKFSYAYDQSGCITTVYPQYRLSIEETESARKELLQYLGDFSTALSDTMQDGDKALLIHDHIAKQYTYSPAGKENYDIYSLFKDGHGVCQAFSLMYMALGRCADLNVDLVTSERMDHAWNHIEIDGEYYHVDVTRNLSENSDDFRHDRFLLCDIGLKNLGYVDFSCREKHECSSHIYDAHAEGIEHTGLMHEITGASVYIDRIWLSHIPNAGAVRLSLQQDILPHERLKKDPDLNEDGVFSLADVLLLTEARTFDCPEFWLDLIRNQLLEEVIS